MASLHQEEGRDDGLKVPFDQSTKNHSNLLHLSPITPLISSTTSDHHFPSSISHNIGSDHKSRSLDVFSASSYSFNNPLISSTDSSKRRASSISADNLLNCHSMHKSSSSAPSDSLGNPVMGSNGATIVSLSSVPFKWEESPGKPIISSSSNELITCNNQSCLQLPPKLQCPFESPASLHPFNQRSPLHQPFNQRSPLNPLSPLNQPINPLSPLNRPINLIGPLNQPTNQSPFKLSHNNPKLKNLCKFLLKTASWSQPLHRPAHLDSQSWSGSPSACSSNLSDSSVQDDKPENLAINQRFFFDRASPKDLKYSVSMDSWKPALPIYDEYNTQDEFVSRQTLSFLAMEEHEADNTPSSPWQPISFHEKEGSASPWPPTPNILVQKRPEEGGGEEDEDADEGFHDFFSTASSLEKPSQRTEDLIESAGSSPSPWFLNFSPEEEEVHEERRGSKMVVTLVALVRLKKIIASKVCKLKKRREGGNEQANTSMWSPTLATYLYNQQKEEKGSSLSLDNYPSQEEEEEEEEAHSNSSSDRLQINPNYHLPSTLRGHLSPIYTSFSQEEGNSLKLSSIPAYFNSEEEEDEPPKLTHTSLSLSEQLADFDEESPLQLVQTKDPTFYPQILDIKRREHTPCKGMCKVQNTVKMLAATIKLILVQTNVRKRKGPQRPSIKYGSCINPMLSPFPSTRK